MNIRIYRKHKDIPLPERKTPGSAGLDIYAAESVELHPGRVGLISTGLIIQCPPGYFYKVHIRSGIAVKNGICLANDVGIIDEDYCGPSDELKVAMVKLYDPSATNPSAPFLIDRGMRIAQIIFEKNALPEVNWEEMESPDFAGQSRGGFGSTGTK